jgi:hypothetical protein
VLDRWFLRTHQAASVVKVMALPCEVQRSRESE